MDRLFVFGGQIDQILAMESPDHADVDGDSNTSEVLRFSYHVQLIGSVTHVTAPSGSVVESYRYDPYGKPTIKDAGGSTVTSSAIKNPYLYTARQLDEETGLYYYRARMYSATLKKFIQRDPLEYVSSPNAHGYVRGRPVLMSDPIGLDGKSAIQRKDYKQKIVSADPFNQMAEWDKAQLARSGGSHPSIKEDPDVFDYEGRSSTLPQSGGGNTAITNVKIRLAVGEALYYTRLAPGGPAPKGRQHECGPWQHWVSEVCVPVYLDSAEASVTLPRFLRYANETIRAQQETYLRMGTEHEGMHVKAFQSAYDLLDSRDGNPGDGRVQLGSQLGYGEGETAAEAEREALSDATSSFSAGGAEAWERAAIQMLNAAHDEVQGGRRHTADYPFMAWPGTAAAAKGILRDYYPK
ncbi:MAG: hypothetical protein HMLKMBBP_03438 [Planctomycetes bacterium]|nr:hypothetical protein [Planctomycetota bacterium]